MSPYREMEVRKETSMEDFRVPRFRFLRRLTHFFAGHRPFVLISGERISVRVVTYEKSSDGDPIVRTSSWETNAWECRCGAICFRRFISEPEFVKSHPNVLAVVSEKIDR